MFEINLDGNDREMVYAQAVQLGAQFEDVERQDFLDQAPVLAQDLPVPLRFALNKFRLQEPDGACLISGFPVDDQVIGPTPSHWEKRPKPSPALPQEIFFVLCCSLLGEPIGWSTQQGGYIMHSVAPIKGHANEQLGSGSEVTLTWHTEDAFHPYRADYICLMCLRNPDKVETTLSTTESLRLNDATKERLFDPEFIIRPDNSHLPKSQARHMRLENVPAEIIERSRQRIVSMQETPTPVEVLFGDRHEPYLRVDPYFMEKPREGSATVALECLYQQLEKGMEGIALEPGQVLIVDNYRVVHGRRSFKARYDGTDRWLKRLNVTRDLRKSRSARLSPSSRVIF